MTPAYISGGNGPLGTKRHAIRCRDPRIKPIDGPSLHVSTPTFVPGGAGGDVCAIAVGIPHIMITIARSADLFANIVSRLPHFFGDAARYRSFNLAIFWTQR
jgi:hypothetical protein